MFTDGSLIKIKPEIFGSETPVVTDLFGRLGYPGILKYAIFKVLRSFRDSSRGDMIAVEIQNAAALKNFIPGCKEVRYSGEILMFPEDCIRASSKITLDYVINQPDQATLVKQLFEQRRVMKLAGKRANHPDMLANWREIRIARGEIKGENKLVEVSLPKQKLKFEILSSELPKDNEESIDIFKYRLTSMISSHRADLKSKSKMVKTLFDGVTSIMEDGVHVQSGKYAEAAVEKLKRAFDTAKIPTKVDAKYVGIEIEMIYTGGRDLLKKKLAKQRLHNHVRVTDDGSVRACHNAKGYESAELNVLCTEEEVRSVMSKLEAALHDPKIDAYANRSCGLHVHLDMRNRNVELVYKNMFKVQDILRGSQPTGRINNSYCKPNIQQSFGDCLGSMDSKYFVINPRSYEEHKTLEIRVHEGTTDANSISSWVEFLTSIANHTTELDTSYKTAAQLVSAGVAITPSALAYIDSRINRYRSVG